MKLSATSFISANLKGLVNTFSGRNDEPQEPPQEINLGNGIKITIVKVSGDKVKLGVEAPPSTPVSKKPSKNPFDPQNN